MFPSNEDAYIKPLSWSIMPLFAVKLLLNVFVLNAFAF